MLALNLHTTTGKQKKIKNKSKSGKAYDNGIKNIFWGGVFLQLKLGPEQGGEELGTVPNSSQC